MGGLPLFSKLLCSCVLFALVILPDSAGHADDFGSDPDTSFSIEFTSIGNPGNPADTTGSPNRVGSVAYNYRISTYEVSEQMIVNANAQSAADGNPLNIPRAIRGPNKPAAGMTWLHSIKFVNWLNSNSGNPPAYNIDPNGDFQLWQPGDPGYSPDNLYRNRLAKYFLPSLDEWYKAAYYDPVHNVYYDFPAGSDNVPDGIDSPGDPSFDVVFDDGDHNPLPNDVMNVGLPSPYGTRGQGGNIWERLETEFDRVNDSTNGDHEARGGDWDNDLSSLRSTQRGLDRWNQGFSHIGFRVSSIPEPATCGLALAALSLTLSRRNTSWWVSRMQCDS